jgi:hypothetical protein
MGFRLADATNAWCMRCTRGERRFLRAAVWWAAFGGVLEGADFLCEVERCGVEDLPASVDWLADEED